jgi:hypothetical protein
MPPSRNVAKKLTSCDPRYFSGGIEIECQNDPTVAWCGETVGFRQFVSGRQVCGAQGEATVPTSLRVEMETNPFLRSDKEEIKSSLGKLQDYLSLWQC